MTELLKFDQISYNEPVYWLEQQWGRKLSDHEKNIAILIYRFTRTSQEAEEIKILDCGFVNNVGDKPLTAKDLIEATEKIPTTAPKPAQCVVCQDVPQRVNLKGELFCNQCFKDVYL